MTSTTVVVAVLAALTLEALTSITYYQATAPCRVPQSKRLRVTGKSLARIALVAFSCALIGWRTAASVPIYQMVLGAGLFLIGWRASWQELFQQASRSHQRWLRRLIRHLLLFEWPFYVSNSPIGLALQVLGLVVMSKTTVVLAVGAIVVGQRTRSWQQQEYFGHEHSGWMAKFRLVRTQIDDLLPTLGSVAAIVVLLAVARRDLAFSLDQETARMLLGIILQVCIALMALCVTAAFILAQMVVSAYSFRSALVVMHNRLIWPPIILFLMGAGFALWGMAELPAAYRQAQVTTYWPLDASLLLASAGIFFGGRLAFKSAEIVSPESVVAHSIQGLNRTWVDTLRDDYVNRRSRINLRTQHDPLVPVEGVLLRCVAAGDLLSFQTTLALLHDRIMYAIQPDDLAVVEWYLHRHLAPVIALIIQHTQEPMLKHVYWFVREVGMPQPATIFEEMRSSFSEEVAGELILRQIANSSNVSCLGDTVGLAIHEIASRGEKLLPSLPADQDTLAHHWESNDKAMTDAEKKQVFHSKEMIDYFRTNYLSFIGAVGARALQDGRVELAHQCDIALEFLVAALCRGRTSGKVRSRLFGAGLFELQKMLDEATKKGLGDIVSFNGLHSMVDSLDTEDVLDAAYLAHVLAESLQLLKSRACLLSQNVEGIAMVALGLAHSHPAELLKLAVVMADCAEELHHEVEIDNDRQKRWTLHELESRLGQLAQSCNDPNVQKQLFDQYRRAGGVEWS